MSLTCVALPNGRYQTKTLPRCVDVASIKIYGISLIVLEKKSLIQIEHNLEKMRGIFSFRTWLLHYNADVSKKNVEKYKSG